MDDLPPPPYTETDIYSHSGRSPNSRSESDAASVTESSSTIIYTPPETPRESHHNFSGGSGDDHHTSASAQAYFESRPTYQQVSGHDLIAPLAVAEASSPDDLPYPAWARERDTTEQDWHTFVNYLLPDHAARANSHVVDRKLQAQDEAQSPRSERAAAEAQLGRIRESSDLPTKSSAAATTTTHSVDDIIRQWNDGFFGPRGVAICRQLPQPPFPGIASSSSASSRAPPTTAEQVPTNEFQPQLQEQQQQQNARSRWNPFRSFDVNNRGGVRLGGLTIDGDRVSFGNSFEVDRNGVRWNGNNHNNYNMEPGHQPGPGPRGGPFGGFRGRGINEHNHERGRGNHGGGRWWRNGHNHNHNHHGGPRTRSRSRSVSSHSSSSSSSSSRSSHSDSSIGSLPDWDDLKDTQLPLTKQSVATWLAHPEQPVTKEMLRTARSSIKAAKSAPPPANDPAWETNKKVLRQEVKAMLARFNELKREQKRARRAARREKRAERKAARRERRALSKTQSRAQRDYDRQLRRLERQQGRRSGTGTGNGNGDTSRSAYVPDVPPVPNFLIPSPPVVPNIHAPPVPNVAIPPIPSPSSPRGGPRWHHHVRRAHEQAAQARAHARAEADAARLHAATVSAGAQRQAYAARAHGYAQADAARAQAAAAVASARGGGSTSAAGWMETGVTIGVAGRDPLTDKYARADELEAQMARKAEALRGLQATVEREGIEAAMRGGGDVKGKGQTQAQREAEALETEMDGLSREVDRLRLEADGEMARKMEEEEKKKNGGWR
ncbi:hypothetical protein GGR53DRAFT_333017 [Hypoxylon sp. FL1150]|nr:hypothetical protein GGR53DRAFT_333017 [Hypoxylon sp. FL1150]